MRSVSSLIGSLIERFPDAALERRYRVEQRTRQAWFTVRMIYFGTAWIVIYWLFALVAFAPRTAWGIISEQALLVPILLIYAWLVRRPSYAESSFADFFLYSAIQLPLFRSIEGLVAGGAIGWSFNAQLCYSLMIAMAFASLNFTAAVLPFVCLTLASIAYLGLALVFHGERRSVITFTLQNYTFFVIIMMFLNAAMDRKTRRMFKARVSLDEERGKSERLLGNMLPASIAERLKSQEAIADRFDDIVVVFVDLVDFTPLSQQLGPARIVELLNAYFQRADHGTDLFELEKVKTIGDAYMAVTNAITRPPRPSKAAVDFALWLRGEARMVGRDFGIDLRLHVGIASGPAIGGVISAKRLSYDYWGHTVNLAARLQDTAGADGVAVSQEVWREARDSYRFAPPRTVTLKGIGDVEVYDLLTPGAG